MDNNSENGLIFPPNFEGDNNRNSLPDLKETGDFLKVKEESFGNTFSDIPELKENDFSLSDETINVSNISKEVRRDQLENSNPFGGETDNHEESLLNATRKRKTIRLRIILGIIAGILGLLVGAVLFGLWYKDYLLGRVTYITNEAPASFVDEAGNTVMLADLTEETEFEYVADEQIHNFLLIGIDSRSRGYSSTGTGGLADVIMIMSVNMDEGTIKLVSVARDSYVYVPGYSNPMKINAAMSIGGPDLLKTTVENTLRLTIDGYAYVNFYNMAGVIDAVGGVYCNVSSAELSNMNTNIEELNVLYGYDPNFQKVDSTGTIWLNGRQAVAYARIRKVDSDYKRSERQVEVLRSLLTQFMNLSLTGKASAMDDILGLIATNIPADQITDYALDFLPSMTNIEMQYIQLPIEGCFYSGMYGSEWSIRPNWNGMIPYVQEFFYGETTDFDPVRDIPSSPALDSCNSTHTLDELYR